MAALKGKRQALSMLTRRYPEGGRTVDDDGRAAIHLAVAAGHLGCAYYDLPSAGLFASNDQNILHIAAASRALSSTMLSQPQKDIDRPQPYCGRVIAGRLHPSAST
eukprot:scaffold40051_cov23-Prasinocladus_malaysianus.AAC.6